VAVWKWKAIDENGQNHQGISDELDESGMLSLLAAQKLYPTRIQRARFAGLRANRGRENSQRNWSRIARKIGTLLEAGIPILMVVDIMADKEGNPFRKNRWHKVSRCIQAGKDLSIALQELNPPPGLFMTAMVQAGEKSGTLSVCLLEAAEQMEEEVYFEKKIRAALFYPVLLLVVALIVVYTLSVLVLPMYENLFQGFEAELPLITQVLFLTGRHIPVLIAIGSVFMFVFFWGAKNKSWSIPGTKQIRKCKALIQFCSILHRFTDAGIPLLSSLTLLGQITKEKDITRLVLDLQLAVQNGKRISPAVAANGYFPSEACSMLGVAEEAGNFNEMLQYLAQMYRRELQERWDTYSRVVEPVLVLGMAGLVAIVAMGILLPIFDISVHIQ